IDTLAPTASISLSDSALKAGETSVVTITFSEAVSGFDNSDVTVQNGSLSTLSSADGGVTWTGTFTPSVNLQDTSNVVSLAASYTDIAGNSGSIASSANYSVDTLAPTATISLSDSALQIGETSVVTIVFSEAVTGFNNSDVTVQNGSLSTLSSADGGVTWTGTFTPTANLESTSNVVTLASSYTDVAGNSGSNAISANYAIDTLAPTASISLSDSALKIGDTSLVTITFSEAVTGFNNSDVTVQNGSLGTLSSADGGVTWTGTFTPTANLEDASNVITLAASYTDVAGNSGATASSGNYAIDTLAPTLTITTPLSNTDNVLNRAELTAIAGSTFLLQGTAVGLEVGASYSVNFNQKTYTGTVTTANTWSVNIPEADMNALVHGNDYALRVNAQDLAGNDALAVSQTLQVRLAPPDTPTVNVVNTNSLTPTLSGSALKLTDPNDPNSVELPLQTGDAFTVTVHGASYTYTVGGGSNPSALSYDATAKTWSLALPAGVITADGSYDVAVSVSAMGYTVANDISSNELTVDRVAPALSINTFAGDNTLNAQEVTGNLTLSGTTDTSEAGRTVNIAGLSSGTYHATVQADGSWMVTVLAADLALLTDQSTLTASLADVYGNTASATRSLGVDKVLPVVSSVTDDLAGTANAATASVAYTYVFSEAVTGLSSSDFTVTHGSISSITGSGTTWVVNVTPQAGVDGDVITVVLKGAGVTDLAGNPNITYTSNSQALDTLAPNAPALSRVLDDVGTITGNVTDGGYSDDTLLSVRISLLNTNAVENDTVQLYNGSTALGSAVTLSAGDLVAGYVDVSTPTLTNGTTYVLQAKVIDVAGNASAASVSRTLSIDTTAPNAPSITHVTDDVGALTGAVADGGRSDDTQLVVRVSLTGTSAVANDSVQLYDSTSAIATVATLSATDISNGYVDITTYTLSNATSYAFNAKVIDVAGNASAASGLHTVTIDTSAPAAPSITSVTDDVGSVTGAVSNGGRSDDTQLVVRVSLTGTAAVANDTVQLYDNTSTIATVSTLSAADISNGYVDITTHTLSNATTYAFNAKVIDVAGNIGNASPSHTVTIDTTAPVAPSISRVVDDVGSITGVVSNGGRSDDTQLVVRVSLSGTNAQANDTVQLYDSTNTVASALTLSASHISNGYVDITTNSLSNATTYAFNAKVIDVAGNASAASGNYTVTIDTTAPVAPTLLSVTDDVGSITGPVSSGGVTDDTVLAVKVGLTGTNAVANDTVQLYDGTTALGTAVTLSAGDIAAGFVSLNTPTLSNATTYALKAKVIDVAGNASSASASHTVTIDTSAPSAPTILSVTDDVGSITGPVISGGVTDDTVLAVKVSLAGTSAVANDTVQLYNSTTALGTAVTLSASDIAAGFVSLNTPTLSNATTYAFNALVINQAGTASAASPSHTVTIDTTPPVAPSISRVTDDVGSLTGAVSNGGRSDDTQLVVRVSLSGTNAQANDTVQLYDSTNTVASAATLSAADISNGYVDISTNTLSNATTYAFNAKVIDVAGNASAASGNYTVTIDTTAPVAPTLLSVTDDVGSITGPVSSGGVTDDTVLAVKVGLTGTNAVANDTVQLYDGTTALGTAVTLSAGDIAAGFVSLNTPTLSNATTYALKAKVIDVAGNASSVSTSHTVTIDTLAPTASISLSDSALKAGETSVVTITFSEAVSGFDNSDVTVQNGS
ncbi:hypothetical protein B9Z39_16885, partial [Limnohabitans sp. JirII-29]|uniref:beta strand repeat-containing protein n=1 Tax=Limnohabitans sp. JirII-29 TaxID=1835756 RepID=UPI000DD18F2B